VHDQARDVRIKAAYKMTLGALLRSRKCLPREVAKDMAQESISALWHIIMEDGWQRAIINRALNCATQDTRAYKKEEKMKKVLQENGGHRGGNEASRAFVRDIAERGLTNREWQIVHGLYWQCKRQVDIAEELGLTKQALWVANHRTLLFLRQALHRHGITKESWNDWYYNGV